MSSSLYMVAGEPSGDLQGGLLAEALRKVMPEVELLGVGGDRMAAAGVRLERHIRELSVIGFWEVFKHYPRLRRIHAATAASILAKKPSAVVLIDYPGFNLRLAKILHDNGIKVLYYISPQIWAWKPGRINKIKSCVDRMIVLFPFEEALYRNAGVPVSWVGHPLVDRVHPSMERDAFRRKHGLDPARPLVALLPGSREQEVERIGAILAAGVAALPAARRPQAAVAVSSLLPDAAYDPMRAALPRLHFIRDAAYDLIHAADLCVVASGTATLETALLERPMMIVYRTGRISYTIGRRMLIIPDIGLANVVLGRRAAPEVLQDALTPQVVADWIDLMLADPSRCAEQVAAWRELREKLGPPGAVDRVAEIIMNQCRM